MENSNLTNKSKDSSNALETAYFTNEVVKPMLNSGKNEAFLNAYTTGIELMKSSNTQPSMIFIASHNNHVIEAFEVNMSDNSVKHLNPSRFVITPSKSEDVIENVEPKTESVTKAKDYIFVRSKSVFTKIKIKEISYIQAFGDYVNIFVGEKRYTVHLTLRAIEEKLPADMFYRLHRSYLVALDHIDNVEENIAYIGKHPISISIQFRKELLNKLNLI